MLQLVTTNPLLTLGRPPNQSLTCSGQASSRGSSSQWKPCALAMQYFPQRLRWQLSILSNAFQPGTVQKIVKRLNSILINWVHITACQLLWQAGSGSWLGLHINRSSSSVVVLVMVNIVAALQCSSRWRRADMPPPANCLPPCEL